MSSRVKKRDMKTLMNQSLITLSLALSAGLMGFAPDAQAIGSFPIVTTIDRKMSVISSDMGIWAQHEAADMQKRDFDKYKLPLTALDETLYAIGTINHSNRPALLRGESFGEKAKNFLNDGRLKIKYTIEF